MFLKDFEVDEQKILCGMDSELLRYFKEGLKVNSYNDRNKDLDHILGLFELSEVSTIENQLKNIKEKDIKFGKIAYLKYYRDSEKIDMENFVISIEGVFVFIRDEI